MPFLYGAISAILVIALFGSGVFVGFKVSKKISEIQTPQRHEVTEQEKEEIKEMQQQQDAWRVMQNYSADMAYGLLNNPLEEVR